MKLDKKNIIVIILMVLFIMILGIKYYVDISAKKGFNTNEVDTPVNKEEKDQLNNSNEQEEKNDDKNNEDSQIENSVQEKNEKINEEKNTEEEKNIEKGNNNSSETKTEEKQESNNKKRNKSTSDIKKNETSVSKKDSNSNKDSNNKNKDNTISNNTTVKKEEPIEPPKEENKNNESSLSITNDNLRKNIKSKYGVNIGYKDESDVNYVNSYSNFTKQYDDEKIHTALNNIDTALRKYPNGFFFEINKKWKSLTIYLVDQINGNVAGLTDNRNPNNVVILINTESLLFESTLHHEIMHYIDCYLASIIGASTLENSMKDYNPSGFVYGIQTTEYVYYYSNPAYFLSAYSKSDYKEDRAVLFSDMMSRTLKKDYYSAGNPINEKAKLISRQLEKYFDCVSSSVKENWERFIEW